MGLRQSHWDEDTRSTHGDGTRRDDDDDDDDDAKVNDLRNSPRLRSMVRASEDIEEDKRKYFERREKHVFTTDSANDNGARATAMATTSNDKREVAANSNTAVPADFIPAKLRSEQPERQSIESFATKCIAKWTGAIPSANLCTRFASKCA